MNQAYKLTWTYTSLTLRTSKDIPVIKILPKKEEKEGGRR